MAVTLLSGCDLSGSAPPGLVHILNGHHLSVNWVSWSPDGKLVASGSMDTSARVWDAASGRSVAVLRGLRGSVDVVSWSPDGRYLATASDGLDPITLWDTSNWKIVTTWEPGGTSLITSLRWSPDGRTLALNAGPSTGEERLYLWDVQSRKAKSKLIDPIAVDLVDWSPDGKLLAFTTLVEPGWPSARLMLWDPAKGDGPSTSENTTLIGVENDLVHALKWSPDGKFLAAGSFDGSVRIWEVATKQNTVTCLGHKESVDGLAWSPNGKRIASASWDRTVKIWDVSIANSTCTNVATFTHPDFVNTVDWSPDGKHVVTGDHENFGNVRIWEVK